MSIDRVEEKDSDVRLIRECIQLTVFAWARQHRGETVGFENVYKLESMLDAKIVSLLASMDLPDFESS